MSAIMQAQHIDRLQLAIEAGRRYSKIMQERPPGWHDLAYEETVLMFPCANRHAHDYIRDEDAREEYRRQIIKSDADTIELVKIREGEIAGSIAPLEAELAEYQRNRLPQLRELCKVDYFRWAAERDEYYDQVKLRKNDIDRKKVVADTLRRQVAELKSKLQRIYNPD